MKEDEKKLVNEKIDNREGQYGSTSTEGEITLELNQIYTLTGLGRAQYLYWALVALISYTDYAELTLLSLILPSLRCEWELTPYFEAAITLSLFGSYALFSIVLGKISDKYGRKPVLFCSTSGLIFSAIASSRSPNKWIFLISRITTGAYIATSVNCIICYSIEFSESKYRAYGSATFVISAFGGVAFVNGLGYLFLRLIGWRWFILLVSLPVVPALIMVYFLPESPRYLLVSGQQEKSLQAVRFIARLNGKKLPENLEIESFEEQHLGSYLKVFNKENRRLTIALSVIYFFNLSIEMGLIMFLPLLFSSGVCGRSGTNTDNCQYLSQEDLWKLTVTAVGSIVGALFALLSAQKIGRLLPLRTSCAMVLFGLLVFLVTCSEWITFAVSAYVKVLESFTNTLIWIIIPESFPTNIRSTTTGFINSCGKIGGVLGTTSVYLLFYVDPKLLVLIFVLGGVVGFIAALLFDKETRNVSLQDV